MYRILHEMYPDQIGVLPSAHSLHREDIYVGCRNGPDSPPSKPEAKKETVPKHGLGLRIVRSIAEGMIRRVGFHSRKKFMNSRLMSL